MKITFKAVGNGDSILLEWKDKSIEKAGIVDCKTYEGQNPMLNWLKASQLQEIEFIVLSHPHVDHFSGMAALLAYCERSQIKIHRFYHTYSFDPIKLAWANVKASATNQLATLIRTVERMYNNQAIRIAGYVSEDTIIKLSDDFFIRFLGPSQADVDRYLKAVDLLAPQNRSKTSQAANHLSTIIQIIGPHKQAILSSDCTHESLRRIHNRRSDDLTGQPLSLVQIPHHGSINNHYLPLWLDLEKDPNSQAVISVGSNRPSQPSFHVVKDFDQAGFEVKSTLPVHGYASYFSSRADSSMHTHHLLNIASTLIPPSPTPQDIECDLML